MINLRYGEGTEQSAERLLVLALWEPPSYSDGYDWPTGGFTLFLPESTAISDEGAVFLYINAVFQKHYYIVRLNSSVRWLICSKQLLKSSKCTAKFSVPLIIYLN